MRLPAHLAICATALILLQSCSSTETPTNTPAGNDTTTGTPGATVITGAHYIQATVDGKVETQQVEGTTTSTTQMQYSGSRGFGSEPGYRVFQAISFVRATFSGMDNSFRSLKIGFMHSFPEQPYEPAEYDVLVRKGSMGFGSKELHINGVQIDWIDAAGTSWSSAKGTGDQTGSSFVVTDHQLIVYQPGQQKNARFNTKGTFNCRLYDDNGKSIVVTNGKFSIVTVFAY